MSNAVISVKGLKKSFKDNEVLKGVDFEVRRGEIFALLGSNGAGKTTTVNILSTLMKSDGGEVGICGFDVQREPESSPVVGSSRKMTAGVPIRLMAMSSRRFIPPEYLSARRLAASVRLNLASRLSAT